MPSVTAPARVSQALLERSQGRSSGRRLKKLRPSKKPGRSWSRSSTAQRPWRSYSPRIRHSLPARKCVSIRRQMGRLEFRNSDERRKQKNQKGTDRRGASAQDIQFGHWRLGSGLAIQHFSAGEQSLAKTPGALPASGVSQHPCARPRPADHARSKRSRFITLFQAATKSSTNFCCASELP